MKSKNKVSVLVLNDLITDSRVIKESTSLSKKFTVEFFCFGYLGTNHDYHELNKQYNFGINRVVQYNRTLTGIRKKLNQFSAFILYVLNTFKHLRSSDIIHCNDLETLPIGVLHKIIRPRIKVIYDAHEYETETMWMRNLFKKKTAKLLEKILLKYVDRLIVVSNSIGIAYVNDYGLNLTPTTIYNLPNKKEKLIPISLKEKIGIPNSSTLYLFQGGLTNGRGIKLILEAFKKNVSTSHVLFMGSGYFEREVKEISKTHKNIHYLQSVPQNQLIAHTTSADFGILSYENTCKNHDYAAPNKLFEYLMAGIPILASPLSEIQKFITDKDVGKVYENYSTESIHSACVYLEKNKDSFTKNINHIRLDYSWEAQENLFLSIYDI